MSDYQHHLRPTKAKKEWFTPELGQKVYTALNEIYVHRGFSAFITNLDCYCNGRFFAKIQADGLMIATPTGSTAYSLSSGGVPIFPNLNSLIFTPVCPHVMASKPLVLSDSFTFKIKNSLSARGTATVNFDGRVNIQLQPGDSIVMGRAEHVLNTVCLEDELVDWFSGLKRCLNWNVRITQKAWNSTGSEISPPEADEKEVGDCDSDY